MDAENAQVLRKQKNLQYEKVNKYTDDYDDALYFLLFITTSYGLVSILHYFNIFSFSNLPATAVRFC